MVQKVLYIFLGIVIGILAPFAQDIYHDIKTPPYDFSSVWSNIVNSWVGLVAVVAIAGLILLIAYLHDRKEKQSQMDAFDKHIKQAVKEGFKEAIAELRKDSVVNHKKPEDTDANQ
jgi:ABC-type Fe3+ transport system permease subunit